MESIESEDASAAAQYGAQAANGVIVLGLSRAQTEKTRHGSCVHIMGTRRFPIALN